VSERNEKESEEGLIRFYIYNLYFTVLLATKITISPLYCTYCVMQGRAQGLSSLLLEQSTCEGSLQHLHVRYELYGSKYSEYVLIILLWHTHTHRHTDR
jgi:hypothetical protein